MKHNQPLKGERILFITCPFFEYPVKISKAFRELGAEVDMFYSYVNDPLYTILLNLNKKLYNFRRELYLNNMLKKISKNLYDKIFIQHPYKLSHWFLGKLRNFYPKAEFINYNWDSSNIYNFIDYYQYFDKILSFDRDDVEKHKVEYLPLFYTEDFSNIRIHKNKHNIKYDITFIGILGESKNRYKFIKDIEKQCAEMNLSCYIYLQCSKNYYLKSKLKGEIISDVHFKKLTLVQIANIYAKSNCVIDYHNPKQRGLTMRTFEVLGANRKLITTNANIKKEPFYSSKNIWVIEHGGESLDLDFVKSRDFDPIANIDDYSLKSWLTKILS